MKLHRRHWLALGLVAPAIAPRSVRAEPPIIAAVPATPGARVTPVLEGLENPWAIAWLPDGTALVTERAGRLRRVVEGVLDPRPVEGVPQVLALGQGGLLDLALDPGFAGNGYIYLTHSAGMREANRTTVTRARFDGTRLTEVQPILAVTPDKAGGAHFGSRLLFLPDASLLVSVGDGGNPPARIGVKLSRLHAQDVHNEIGKVLRIDRDGRPVPNPPFEANPKLFSIGHRNIQGLAWDRARQRIWATEHGSQGGDELNLLAPGNNHGWPLATHSVEYGSGNAISPHRSLPGMTDPVLVWTPVLAASGLAVWQGDLFAGGLRDQGIRRVRLDGAGRVVGQDRINVGARVRDVRVGPDNALYALTDSGNGRLLRITLG
jgi:glucose/arabinose dehydrogenase